MQAYLNNKFLGAAVTMALCTLGLHRDASATEKLIGINSSMVMSQCLPYVAQEAGLYRKYNLDFQLVYISLSGMVTAAMLAGNSEVALTGAVGFVRAFAQGSTDFVFIGSDKNILTHSIIAGPDLKRPEDLKGKKIGVTRLGANTHYFAIQVLRRLGLDPNRDVTFIQSQIRARLEYVNVRMPIHLFKPGLLCPQRNTASILYEQLLRQEKTPALRVGLTPVVGQTDDERVYRLANLTGDGS